MATLAELSRADQLHLQAAQGWLGLRDWREANHELDQLSPSTQLHPEVLRVRYEVYAAAKQWDLAVEVARAVCKLVPESLWGWIHCAYALRELKRTAEAWNVLLPVVNKFPDQYIIRYNLACYACQLGRLKEAGKWLADAIDRADTKDVKLMALSDPDLEPLWADISQI
jgi:predicted Zn-dependent protease